MCNRPFWFNEHRIPCRHCRLCRLRRIQDWIGRAMAEETVSDHVCIWTLTYKGDGPETRRLDSSHVSNFIRSLRKAGHKVRFLSAGEYGTNGGRAHWHVCTWHKGSMPDVTWSSPTARNPTHFDTKHWPWGFVTAQKPHENSYFYAIKYLTKQQGNEGCENRFSMSKKPPLGHEFFMRLAADHVEQGLALQSPEYQFRNVKNRNGTHKRFFLQGTMREKFLAEYNRLWIAKYGEKPPPMSDFFVEKYLDPIARKELAADGLRLERDLDARRKRFNPQKLRDEDFTAEGFDPYGADRQSLSILPFQHRLSDGSDVPASCTVYTDDSCDLLLDSGLPYRLGRAGYRSICDQVQRSGLGRRNQRRVTEFLCKHWRVTIPKKALLSSRQSRFLPALPSHA